MGRRLRYVPGETLIEICTRTIQGRHLLRPSPEANKVILGVLGRALDRQKGIRLHAYIFLSNHYHILLTAPDAPTLSRFMSFLNGNLSKEIGLLHEWTGTIWDGRYDSTNVLDDESARERLEYVLSNGVKEGLVAKPSDWPGVSCIDTLLGGGPARGIWYDRTALCHARKRRPETTAEECAIEYEVALSPLPCWADKTPEEQLRLMRQLVAWIEEKAAQAAERSDRKPLGANGVARHGPHFRPRRVKRSPSPFVHTATREAADAFRTAYQRFVATFRGVLEQVEEALPQAGLPPGGAAMVIELAPA